MDSEEARFRAAIPKSMKAVHAFAQYLQRKGLEVIVHEAEVRPSFEQRQMYGDAWDVKARRGTLNWLRFEVKGREIPFTGRHDFPYPSIMAERVSKPTRMDWYVTVSQDLQYAGIVEGARRDEWTTATIFDRTKGYHNEVYLVPLRLVHFVRLT